MIEKKKYEKLADRGLWDIDDADIHAFYKRAQIEGVELVSNNVPKLGLFRAPYEDDYAGADIVIQGIPLDIGVPNPRPGTRNAPKEIRFWSLDRNMTHYFKSMCPFDLCNVADLGDMEFRKDMYNLESNIQEIGEKYSQFQKHDIFPLTLGGEHTCTYGILKGLGAKEPLAVIHLDAHSDTSVNFGNTGVSDASLFQKAVVDGYVNPEKMVQIGQRGRGIIRSDFARNSGMRTISAEEAQDKGMGYVAEEVKRIIGNSPCYLTFDTDCIDCGEMPGTTLPEPFGLFGREVRDFIRSIYGMNIVGADIMELSPDYDPTGQSACLASGIAFELFCLLADSKYRKNGRKNQTHWIK